MASGGLSTSWWSRRDPSISPSTVPLGPDQRNGQHGGRGANEIAAGDQFPGPSTDLEAAAARPQLDARPEQTRGIQNEVTNHASTPPIPVPSASNHNLDGHHSHYAHPHPLREGWQETSPFEDALKTRPTAITFHPKVTLDTGHEKELDEPLSRPSRWATGTRPRGRSLLKELSVQPRVSSPLTRACSDSDRTKYDPFTGQFLHRTRPPSRRAEERARPHAGEARHPLLQPTVDELAQDGYAGRCERMASLTSASSASPPLEDIRTPPESPSALAFPPVVTTSSSSPRQVASAEESGSWPVAHEMEPSRRTKSELFEKPSKFRAGRRAASLRSPNSMSPASAFLSTWGKAAAAPEPDDEGQQVVDYVLGKQVGYGGFSIVKEAFGIEDGQPVKRAVKIVRKQISGRSERENEQLQAEFEHEVSLWRYLSHRHILPLLFVYDTPFATYCFTELHTAGSLFDLVRNNRFGLPAQLARRYASQLASALRYLHEDVHVVHRDVKLENCLLDMSDPKDGGALLLCDFGMAEFMPNEGSGDGTAGSPDPYERVTDRPAPRNIGPSVTSTSVVGSLEYASPELLTSSTGLFLTATDIWAYGVVLYALLVGNLPFRHTFLPRVQMMILKGEWDEDALRYAPGMDDRSGEHAVEVVRGCLDMEVERRWGISQVLNSDLLVEVDVDGGANTLDVTLNGTGMRVDGSEGGDRGWIL